MAEIYYNAGKRMRIIIQIKPLEQKKQQINTFTPTNDIYRFCELRECYIDTNGNTLEYTDGGLTDEAKLKGVDAYLAKNYYQGNKSVCLFNCSAMMVKDGFDENFIVNYLMQHWEANKNKGDKFKDCMGNITGAFRL